MNWFFFLQRNGQNPFHYAASLHVSGRAKSYEEFLKFVVKMVKDVEMQRDLLNTNSDRGTVLHVVANQSFEKKKTEVSILLNICIVKWF